MVKFGIGLLLLLLPVDLLAQAFAPNPDWRFENFNSQNHFISREISELTIDKYGYVWTCSRGIQRFDGYRTIDFNSLNKTSGALRSNYADVATDSTGRVWISSGGLCFYDDLSGKFIYVNPDANHHITYTQGFCFQKNYLWFVCDYGLAKLNMQSLKMSFTSLTGITDPLSINMIDENTILISSREKVYAYNIKKNTYSSNTLIYNHSSLKVFAMIKRGATLFLGTSAGLFTLNNLTDITPLSKGVKDLIIADMLFLPGDKEKKYLFLATDGKGLMIYNTVLKKIEYTYLHDDNNPLSLSRDIVLKLFCDKAGRLWISTASGISMLDVNNQQLKVRFLKGNNGDGLNITKIARDKYDSTKVWMSCYTRGMICVNWKTKKIEKIFNVNPELQKIYDFAQVSKNKWLLVTQKKIMEWYPQSGILLKKALPVPDSIAHLYYIRGIIMKDANTCFITTNKGLFKYGVVKRQLRVAAQNTGSKKIGDQLKYNLQNGLYDNGMLWIASRNGLFSYNIKTAETKIYSGKGAAADYFLFDVSLAGNNQVVCAAGSGINIFNKQTKSFSMVNSIANLNKPDCENVISVNNTVWINSEAGILNYNLDTHISARVEHEMSLLQTFPGSPITIIGNDIVFGFSNGFVYFTPDLKNIPVPSDPVLEGISVNNQVVSRHYSAQKSGAKLIFNHSENSINIAFTSFLYTDPDHINFRYRLKGADTKWQYTEDLRNANYAQLPPGDYTFYVQSGNKNGVWNKNLASFSFLIQPPYWETWWFRLLVILLIASGLYNLYRYKIKHILAIESIRESIASDFHDDLGSTLSSISIFSEVAVKKADTDLTATKNMIGDIGTRARAMINSMNDMVWTIKPENDNLYRLMQRMEEFSYPIAEAKEIELVFLMDKSIYDIKTDMVKRKNLFLVFKEAFNNAVKYSNAGNIEVAFKLKQKKILMMQITDNGCGFDHEKIKPGNGLKNMEKRAAEIKGKLQVESAVGSGTSVNIVCKIT